MTRYDRYAIGQMTAAFGALALVLAAVYWVNRAVSLFDRLIADGQGFAVFLEFTALTLPEVLRLIVPAAAFIAAAMVAARLRSDNELSVLRAAGASSRRIAAPALGFGLLAALAMSILVHVLAPAAREQLALRGDEIAADAAAGLLVEGAFLHPMGGVTFYLRELAPDGTLRDVFLSDMRDAANPTTYTAARARLTRGPNGRAQLVMRSGLAQTMRTGADGHARLFTTRFDAFSYDLAPPDEGAGLRTPRPRELTTRALLGADLPRAEIVHELARRSAEPLEVVAAALVAFCALLMGQHARTGRWWQVAVALLVVIAMKGVEGALIGPVEDDPRLWWLQFVPPLAAIFAAGVMLAVADGPAGPRLRGARA